MSTIELIPGNWYTAKQEVNGRSLPILFKCVNATIVEVCGGNTMSLSLLRFDPDTLKDLGTKDPCPKA